MKKSTEFLTDYIIGTYEAQGNFNNISSSPVYGNLYRRINILRKPGTDKQSVKEYVYKTIGYAATEHFTSDMRHLLTTHCQRYNTIENLKDIDYYIHKKYKTIVNSCKDTLTEEELLAEIGLEGYKGKEVSITNRYENNKVVNALYTLYKQIIEADIELLTQIKQYFATHKMFNINNMRKVNPELEQRLMETFLDYGGTLQESDIDIVLSNGLFYTKKPFTENKDAFVSNVLYMCIGILPTAPLNASERYLIDVYYAKYGNFRYMYRRSPVLYKILMSIAAEVDMSFKELLATQGYNHQPLTYSSVDYTAKGEHIEARIAGIESNETIIMDRRVYAYLYDNDDLLNLDIVSHPITLRNGEKRNLRIVAYASGPLKGKYVSSIVNQVDYVTYLDGNTLNISTNNVRAA